MKIIVTHTSPDLDGITSIWLIKRFLPGWEEAEVQFVPAGERIGAFESQVRSLKDPIETVNGNEVINVDTGFGPLDHHQIDSQDVSAASLTFDFVKKEMAKQNMPMNKNKEEAIGRIIKVVTEIDHFKEVFWENPTSDRHDFSLLGIIEGLKVEKPGQDLFYVDFITQCLNAILHEIENKVWAEEEIEKKGVKFETRWGKGIGIETVNDAVMKLAQKMGYVIVVRKDPRKGYVRVNAKPSEEILPIHTNTTNTTNKSIKNKEIDLTLVCEKLKKIDPEATWFLHVSKKILLNGSVKNPKMKPTTLSLEQIIKVLEKI